VKCENWNVRQATSRQVFNVTTFRTDTCFQSFLPLINCIVHHAVLKFSPCRNKTLLQLVRVADWYSIHAFLQHVPDAVIYRVEVRTVGAEVRLCHEHDVLAHCQCLAERETRLQQCCGLLVTASASATRLGNTAR